MAEITMDHIEKVYPNGFKAVHDFSLHVEEGEFLVLVGPSGCGKSTALRMVAGLEEITSGELKIGDRVVNGIPPKDRDIAMVFQNYALYPHMSVFDNIGFALKLKKVPKDEIDRRVREAARILELEENLERKPAQLSGGQRQRVAMGRAIVRQPAAFLMDEPLSNLDAKLRVQMRAEIARLQRNLGVTTLYVTHDQIEAMTMGDRVAVMRAGHLQQVDAPQVLYDRPSNLFVAAFIGSPSMNLFESAISADAGDGTHTVDFGSQRLVLDPVVFESRPRLAEYAGRKVIAGVRPEDFEDVELESGNSTTEHLTVGIDLVEALGSEILAHFTIDATTPETGDPDALEEVGSEIETKCVAKLSPQSRLRPGHSTQLAVHTARMHFFDTETGQAIRD